MYVSSWIAIGSKSNWVNSINILLVNLSRGNTWLCRTNHSNILVEKLSIIALNPHFHDAECFTKCCFPVFTSSINLVCKYTSRAISIDSFLLWVVIFDRGLRICCKWNSLHQQFASKNFMIRSIIVIFTNKYVGIRVV